MTVKELKSLAMMKAKEQGIQSSWIQFSNKTTLENFVHGGVIPSQDAPKYTPEETDETEEYHETETIPEVKETKKSLIGISGRINISLDIANPESLLQGLDTIKRLLLVHGITIESGNEQEEERHYIEDLPDYEQDEKVHLFEQKYNDQIETGKGEIYEQ